MINDLIYVLSLFTKRTKGENICIVKQASTRINRPWPSRINFRNATNRTNATVVVSSVQNKQLSTGNESAFTLAKASSAL